MCGIVGFLHRRAPSGSLGRILMTMLGALSCRGPDSAGVALFQQERDPCLHLRVPHMAEPQTLLARLDDLPLTCRRIHGDGVISFQVGGELDPVALERKIQDRLPGVEVLCQGKHLKLFKQVGSPAALDAAFSISRQAGSHGIGHTRLSTESRVDLSHSQPFWAHGVPDLATVHNGHITNYHKLRRHYEGKGHRFFTDNDSELIGVYLRDRLAAGISLEDVLHASLDAFDGSYCYLVARADTLALVKDRFSFKPLVEVQTEDFVALATEEIALRQALPGSWVAREPLPGTVKVWHVPQLQPA